ncbi:MAG: FAD-binding oxidoreductase [Usitatibacter sp.]
MIVRSWGNYPKVEHAEVLPMEWRHLPLPRTGHAILPGGLARSYGDSCLNEGEALVTTARLDRLVEFDRVNGWLRCEAGMSLAQILAVIVPAGWFLPVVPGTAFVTVGGAIANDVHGKNHQGAGSFGHHVRRFELLRSDGSRVVCSPAENGALFRATVGGLGLTGLVTWAEIALRPVRSAFFDVETIRMEGLDHFFALSEEKNGVRYELSGSDSVSDNSYLTPFFDYSVAWIDALATGSGIGRGIFMRARHSEEPGASRAPAAGIPMPLDLPARTLNRYSVGLFNALYRSRASGHWKRSRLPYAKYLFPLDAIGHWNRMYGKRGFLQHQSVVPRADARAKLAEMLAAVAQSGDASFLTVLKVFGDREPAGLLSFERPGVTLALEIPMRGAATFVLLERLDAIVRDAGGAIYPAKDARMSPETFRASFPRLDEFRAHVDPKFSSSFWRRVSR